MRHRHRPSVRFGLALLAGAIVTTTLAIEKDLDAARAAYQDLIDKDLSAYRKAMADRKM